MASTNYEFLGQNGVKAIFNTIKKYFVPQETGKGLSTNDFTDADKTALSNAIQGVEVNGTALTPTSGVVDVTVPTKTSDLTNDSDFLSATVTSPTTGQILAYTESGWVNQSPQTFSQQQSNWDETDSAAVSFIQNKPTFTEIDDATVESLGDAIFAPSEA